MSKHRYRIHFTVGGVEDSIVVENDDIRELQRRAKEEVAKRGGEDPWSEELS